jgi:hypothetical protein
MPEKNTTFKSIKINKEDILEIYSCFDNLTIDIKKSFIAPRFEIKSQISTTFDNFTDFIEQYLDGDFNILYYKENAHFNLRYDRNNLYVNISISDTEKLNQIFDKLVIIYNNRYFVNNEAKPKKSRALCT